MAVKERLEEALKAALKGGRKDEVAVVRLTLSEIKSAEKDRRRPLTEAEEFGILRTAVKKRQEAIALFRQGGREDLAVKEEGEIRLLEGYLPAVLTPEELEGLVAAAIAETKAASPKDLGAVMKWLMPRLEGRADGQLVNRLVREKLTRS